MKHKADHCSQCNWHGSVDDPLMRFFPHEPLYCRLGHKCRERQQANRDRLDPPEEVTVENAGVMWTGR